MENAVFWRSCKSHTHFSHSWCHWCMRLWDVPCSGCQQAMHGHPVAVRETAGMPWSLPWWLGCINHWAANGPHFELICWFSSHSGSGRCLCLLGMRPCSVCNSRSTQGRAGPSSVSRWGSSGTNSSGAFITDCICTTRCVCLVVWLQQYSDILFTTKLGANCHLCHRKPQQAAWLGARDGPCSQRPGLVSNTEQAWRNQHPRGHSFLQTSKSFSLQAERFLSSYCFAAAEVLGPPKEAEVPLRAVTNQAGSLPWHEEVQLQAAFPSPSDPNSWLERGTGACPSPQRCSRWVHTERKLQGSPAGAWHQCWAPSVTGKCCSGWARHFCTWPSPWSCQNSCQTTLCPCLSLVLKHPGQLMCRFDRRKQPEQPPLIKGKGGVSCSSHSGEATQPDCQVPPEPCNLSPLGKRRGPKPGISAPTNLHPLLKEWHCSL